MRKAAGVAAWVAVAISLGVLGLGSGCEKNDGDGTRYLSVLPPVAVLGTNYQWVTFHVLTGGNDGQTRDLSLPLEWWVGDSRVGTIVGPTAGYEATYFRFTDTGTNRVYVRDQYGTEGYAFVQQVPYSTSNPNITLPTGTNTAQMTTQ
jgi:hypothetical protein